MKTASARAIALTSDVSGAALPELRAVTTPLPADVVLPRHIPGVRPLLWLDGHGYGLVGLGEAARLPVGTGPGRWDRAQGQFDDLAARTLTTDQVCRPGTGLVAFGSFAFDPNDANSALIVPALALGRDADGAWLTAVSAVPDGSRAPAPHAAVENRPVFTVRRGARPADWDHIFAVALDAIARGEVDKVVLARSEELGPTDGLDVRDLLIRLNARFPQCHTFAADDLVGATPEMLLRVRGAAASSRVLAGSAPRGGTKALDDLAGRDLLRSAKDLREHLFAVRSVAAALSAEGAGVERSAPFLVRLENIQHLATDVLASLPAGVAPLRLLGRLHPSAAVCGTPRASAMVLIRSLEDSRGRYSGPVGWLDAKGNCDWGIALRCADLSGGRIRAYAGAGLVEGSEPDKELAEIRLKLDAIGDALTQTASASASTRCRPEEGSFGDDIAILADLWLRWWQFGHRLADEQWSGPTRLERWRVRELYAHVARGIVTLGNLLADPTGAPAEIPHAAAYFARLRGGPASADEVARIAVQFAADTGDAGLADLFGRAGIEVLTAAAALAPSTVLASIAGPIRLHSYLVTRIVEATVHMLDLQHALDAEAVVPEPALLRTVQVLVQLIPSASFIDLATGRGADPVFPVLT